MFGLVPFYGRKRNLKPALSDFENFVERFFNEDMFFVPVFGQSFRVDVKETEKEYIVEAELPGMEKDNINLTYEDGALTISAKKEVIIDEEKENFVRRERRSGNIDRRLYFENVDEDKISASYKNGLLIVSLPKKETKDKRGKAISIE